VITVQISIHTPLTLNPMIALQVTTIEIVREKDLHLLALVQRVA
jgi:hypothetical protein